MCIFYNFSAFNNVWSNIGYFIMGLTFLGVVAVRYAWHMYIVISLIKKTTACMSLHDCMYICTGTSVRFTRMVVTIHERCMHDTLSVI